MLKTASRIHSESEGVSASQALGVVATSFEVASFGVFVGIAGLNEYPVFAAQVKGQVLIITCNASNTVHVSHARRIV
jgi:hypothetical protein